MTKVRPLHVLVKAIILYVAANISFAYLDLHPGRLSIYNSWVPGRQRVPYEREEEYYMISHTIPVYEDLDAMYESHIISEPPHEDEYRVVLLGDSSAWGFGLQANETLAAQLNLLDLTACDGRQVVVYNAGFPLPYLMKDLLLMDKTRAYDPDMYLWSVTIDAFRNRTVYTNYFLSPHGGRVHQMVDEYGIHNLDTEGVREPGFLEKTIFGRRAVLKKMLVLQLHGFGWSATGLDYHDETVHSPVSNDVSASLLLENQGPDEVDFDTYLFDVLEAGYQNAGDVPLLVLNEPIFVASGRNSDIRYNDVHPRWAYDRYLELLADWMNVHQHEYINAWNALPQEGFSDAFHRTPYGEQLLAEIVAPALIEITCSQ